ncbi:protein of unknown function [Methylocella tundrae]|uniref:Transposase n=1 Tax=Methylocella tundrae TaxID=227605 RepID=A0A4U8Z4P9_METTU|nr:protein of unknown function [Methylocella tundrae]
MCAHKRSRRKYAAGVLSDPALSLYMGRVEEINVEIDRHHRAARSWDRSGEEAHFGAHRRAANGLYRQTGLF